MWETVELNELRVFLTLCDELHFGRTAERLHLSQSRVSQLLQALETRVGAKLFERTSRRVALTPVGEQLRDRIVAPYRQLEAAFSATRAAANGISGTLRIGLYTSITAGPHMPEIVSAFRERHPACEVMFFDTGLVRSPLDWLRDADVDMLTFRLPLSEPGIKIGPVLARESRVVAVALGHPLAGRDSVSYEDLADYPVSDVMAMPRETMDAFVPPRTPSGRLLRRIEQTSISEATMRVATGVCVHPTVASFLEHLRHPGVTVVPIRDLPPSESALIWLEDHESPKVTAFARTAADVLRDAGHRRSRFTQPRVLTR
jgi:DNA-binding transcriptional LysR family regulator